MNKIISNLFCFLLLTSCVASTSMPIDEEVLKTNKIVYTLEMYNKYRYDTRKYRLLSEKVYTKDNSSVALRAIDCSKNNDYEYVNNSDECVIFRKNNEERLYSGVKFFDYKRFLPKDSNIKNDDDFIRLVERHNKYKQSQEGCHTDTDYSNLNSNRRSLGGLIGFELANFFNLNSNKREGCSTIDEIEKDLKDYIYDGILKEKDEERKKKEKEIAQKEQEIAEKKKEKSYIEDCKNAEKKAEEYMKSIPSEGFMILEYTHVVDFAKDGVFVEGYILPVSGVYTFGRVFVYTKDTEYATGESFRSNGVFYKQNGYYKYTTITGATNSVVAFVPTKYKVEKAEYQYYLKNKDLTCKKDFIIYEENGEEKHIERKD